MNGRALVAVLATVVSAAFAQTQPSAMPPGEAVCGFIAGPSFYSESADVKQGLVVDLFVGDARVGQPTKLKFYINQKPGGQPVDNVQIEHEQFMHVIGVRDDLNEFFHLHPRKVSPGMWVATHTFTNAGRYKHWSDVKWRGASYSFGLPRLNVSGRMLEANARNNLGGQAVVAGFRVTLQHSEPLTPGRTNVLEFKLSDARGAAITTEHFLGAPMHLVIVSEDLAVFLHAHPETRAASDPAITFRQAFPKPGLYKLFAQFRPWKTKLPPDEAMLAEFYLKVAANAQTFSEPQAATARQP